MNRLARSLALLLFLLLVAVPTIAQDYAPLFEEGDCPFPELEGVVCGWLIVPEDRSNPGGNQVELAVAIIEATGPNVAPEPVIYLEGGPGGSALLGIEDFMRYPLVETHDLIVFDQRGTGFSLPSLNCFEMEEDEDEDAVSNCRARLIEEGVDLNQYNSAASAVDVEDLRIALEYDEVKLYGISYGTRLALTVLRDFPDNIHSAAIDSVYPPEIDDLALTTTSRMGAINALFNLCSRDGECSAAFPNLESDFYAMVTRLNDNPAEIDGEELFGEDVADRLISALYNSEIVPYLPFALDLIANAQEEFDYLDGIEIIEGVYIPDEDEPLEDNAPESILDSDQVMAYFDEVGDIDDSEGMNFSVDCSEEYALNDVDQAYALAEQAPAELREYFIISVEQTLQGCQDWGVVAANSIEAERVVSDVPTLLVSGAVDPVTPPESGDSALAGLSNGQHVVFPTAGHSITFTSTPAGTCAASMVIAFFNDPMAAVDTSCVAATSDPNFYIGD